MPNLISLKQTRAKLGNRSRTTVHDKINRGLIEAVKDGKRTLVVEESVDRHIESLRRVEPKDPPPA